MIYKKYNFFLGAWWGSELPEIGSQGVVSEILQGKRIER